MNFSTNKNNNREKFLLTTAYYTVQDGYGENLMPILHLCGRGSDGSRVTKRIVGFRPRFWISQQEFVEKRGMIERQLEKSSSTLINYGFNHPLMDGRETIDGVMLVCTLPTDVKDIREEFDRTWEADVQFPDVFKLNKGITTGVETPSQKNEVHHSEVRATDVDIDERVCTFDIEVQSTQGFPDPENPIEKITAIASHDSYTDETWVGVLRSDEWSDTDVSELRAIDDADTLTLYNSDKELLYDYISHIRNIQPDIFTGWSSNSFDIPYIINRGLKLNVGGMEKLSPTGDVEWISDPPRSTNYSVKGPLFLDGLELYKAVRVGQQKSFKLEDVAQNELGYGKDDVTEFDEAWRHYPVQFVEYNIKDVDLVVELLDETNALTDFRGRRKLTGQRLDKCQFPRNLIDNSTLAMGREYL